MSMDPELLSDFLNEAQDLVELVLRDGAVGDGRAELLEAGDESGVGVAELLVGDLGGAGLEELQQLGVVDRGVGGHVGSQVVGPVVGPGAGLPVVRSTTGWPDLARNVGTLARSAAGFSGRSRSLTPWLGMNTRSNLSAGVSGSPVLGAGCSPSRRGSP